MTYNNQRIPESIKYSGIYMFVYMSLGSFMPMIGKYYQSLGYTGTEIGIITACGTAISIFSVILWGRFYGRSTHKKRILCFLCFAAAVMCIVTGLMRAIVMIILTYSVLYFFHAPVLSLTDTKCMESGTDFGASRKWGAVGYSSGVLISAKIADAVDMKAIFVIYFVSYVIAALFVASLNDHNHIQTRPHVNIKRNNITYRTLMSNRKFVMLLISVFFYGGTNVANNTYFGFVYTEAGGTLAGVGVCMFFMILAETPFMAYASKLSSKFSIQKMILVAMIVSSIRFLWYSTLPVPWFMTVLFFLPGFVNGILLVEIIRYIGQLLPSELISMGVSIYYMFASNMSTIVCQYLGGAVLDAFGAVGVYRFFGLYNVVGIILYIIFRLYKKPSSAQSTE